MKKRNCLQCPRSTKFKDGFGQIYQYYCAFAGFQECIYGEHYAADDPAYDPVVREAVVRGYIPPKYKATEHPSSIQWERIHNKIFLMLHSGHSMGEIAKILGIKYSTLSHYVGRY